MSQMSFVFFLIGLMVVVIPHVPQRYLVKVDKRILKFLVDGITIVVTSLHYCS